MSWMRPWRPPRMKDPAAGTAEVVGTWPLRSTTKTSWPGRGTWVTHGYTLILRVDGVPVSPVECKLAVPVGKPLLVGQAVPVTVDRDDPSRVHVHWDELPDARERSMDRAQRWAARPGAAPAGARAWGDPGMIGQADGPQEATDDDRGVAPRDAEGSDTDRITRLERLARLRDRGVLTEAEFQREKARILGMA